MTQEARTTIFVTIVDDETSGGDEIEDFLVTESVELDEDISETGLLQFDKCAGGEVRVTGDILASLELNQRIRFQGNFHLYEGTECDTTNPEGPMVHFERVVAPQRFTTVNLDLPGSGAGSAHGVIRLSNRTLTQL